MMCNVIYFSVHKIVIYDLKKDGQDIIQYEPQDMFKHTTCGTQLKYIVGDKKYVKLLHEQMPLTLPTLTRLT